MWKRLQPADRTKAGWQFFQKCNICTGFETDVGNTSERLVTCSLSQHCVWKLKAPVSNVKTEMFQHSRASFITL